MMYNTVNKEVTAMKLIRLNIQLPQTIKARLDALRGNGTTASGFIRCLLEQHFNQPEPHKKGR
jgi:hypothetical protein